MAKKVAKLPFDPAVFLATVDTGRTLSDYHRNEVIFTQGDPADAVFYIKTGKVKITVISEQGSCCCGLGFRRILRRGMPGRTDAAHGDSQGNERMRDHAAGEGGNYPRPP
jgi:CRP-like cAMP-binding protein